MQKIVEFLKEARAELLRVVWPTKERMIRDTLIVLGISAATAVFLGSLDFVFESLAKRFLF
ncbi:MAG: preprotein translocase subunit SecE [Candidatus Moranbacteria bacterium]|nr:preprotein translocase subunit SecE [Candidatus Moranbacteria bacterium]NTW45812.1 preprotein translocase subunit SecE [Candidatus Moranbacteria bacterium]